MQPSQTAFYQYRGHPLSCLLPDGGAMWANSHSVLLIPLFDFEFQYAADTLVYTILGDHTVFHSLNHGIKGFDEVMWTKNDVSTCQYTPHSDRHRIPYWLILIEFNPYENAKLKHFIYFPIMLCEV